MSLITELKRRNVIRMAGLYLVGAWLLVQVAGTVLPWFSVPPSILRGLVLLLVIGFVPALVFAWVFELTPEGLKRDAQVDPAQSIAPRTARRMDRMIIAVLLLALAYFGFDKFVLAPARDAALANASGTRAAADHAAAKPEFPARSIAVLPFVNMSTDPENEFFSDGLSEEILNSLARIDGMQVVARTSSFQFKGRNTDLRAIGKALGVGAVLEGSVRRVGEQARITAQLIRTSDGIHLWSETYDRGMQDTLAVQLDIAEKVAGVLNVVLDERQRVAMRKKGLRNVDAFIAYQKGLKLYEDAHGKPGLGLLEGLRLANVEFDRATALEPEFYEPHFAKADLYEHLLQSNDPISQAERLAAQHAALDTLQLAANSARDEQQRVLTLAERQMLSDDWHDLPALIDAAFTTPGCNSSNWLPVFASAFGYGDEIEAFGKRASACDPLNRINYSTRITAALANGQAQRALLVEAAGRKALGAAGPPAGANAAQAMTMLGKLDAAERLLAAMSPDQQNEGYYTARVLLARARGEPPAEVHARLQAIHGKPSKYGQWLVADAVEAANAGDRAEANRIAALLDARPAGGLLLAVFAELCRCGAPFDLAATPNFKARLSESGFRWPPPASIQFPAKASATTR